MKKEKKEKIVNTCYRLNYKQIISIVTSLIIAILLFYLARHYRPFHDWILSLGYFGTFIGGLLYTYGFTAVPATAMLLILAKGQNILIAVIVGGIGAVISDMILFHFVRSTFTKEIECIKNEKFVQKIANVKKKIFGRFYPYVYLFIASILIASPLPTEVGITMMASAKKLTAKKFMLIAYILHTIGILVVLATGKLI